MFPVSTEHEMQVSEYRHVARCQRGVRLPAGGYVEADG